MAANFKMVNPVLGAPSPATLTATTQQWPLGFEAAFADQNSGSANVGCGKFVYVQGGTVSAPQSAGQAVQLVSGFYAQLAGSANTATVGPLGIAAGAISASNVFGWVQVQGVCDYVRGASAGDFGAVGAPVFIGTTNGQIQTTAGATGYLIHGAFVAATGASVAKSTAQSLILNYPNYNKVNL